MNELQKIDTHLPDTIEGLAEFILIGKEALKLHQAKINAIKNIGRAETAHRAALQDGQDAGKSVINAEAKLGELLKAIPKKKATSGRGSRSLPKGITHKTSHQAQTIADNPEIVQAVIDAAIKADKIPTPDLVYKHIKRPHVLHNSGEIEWFTPACYIDAVRRVINEIDLDPASSATANSIVRATRYFTKEDSGLDHSWAGRVFMNPPYSGALIESFITKFITHFKQGDIKAGIVLVNNATETTWFLKLIDCASAFLFKTGRIKFIHPESGKPIGTPLQGQAFLYFGNEPEKFLLEFNMFGWGAILGERHSTSDPEAASVRS